MSDAFNEILDDLDTQMLFEFEDYTNTILDTWQNFDGNPGQMTLIEDYILPVCLDHISFAKEEWPINVGPSELVDEILNSYGDPDVIDRAFSDTIDDLFSVLDEIYTEANDAQANHDDLLGYSEAHSTNPPWS